MKQFFQALALVGAFLIVGESKSGTNPFRGAYLCGPRINPSEAPLEFRLRETTSCKEGETLLKVYPQSDGTVLLYPAPLPSEPEADEALKRFKEFYGITQ